MTVIKPRIESVATQTSLPRLARVYMLLSSRDAAGFLLPRPAALILPTRCPSSSCPIPFSAKQVASCGPRHRTQTCSAGKFQWHQSGPLGRRWQAWPSSSWKRHGWRSQVGSLFAAGGREHPEEIPEDDDAESQDGELTAAEVEQATQLLPRREGLAGATFEGPQGAGDGRPYWAPDWAPTWLVNIHPVPQTLVVAALYFFHMLCLSRGGLALPVQLIPNSRGLFQSVGLDTLAGAGVLALALGLRKGTGRTALPPLLRKRRMPWQLELKLGRQIPKTLLILAMAYITSGWSALVWEYVLYGLAAAGLPITVAMHRSLQVLLSHLVWVFLGVHILGRSLRPFFDKQEGRWMTLKWQTYWLWWVIGGYYVSSFLFNMADLANQFVLPIPPETESVVAKMINPEDNDVASLAVGSIAPCLTAPWWEEVLYRGFLLPALTLFMPRTAAVPASAVLFAAHHLNLQSMLPLTMLGLVWAMLYILSGNLLVTVIIHGMWNSRVFLGSLLGI